MAKDWRTLKLEVLAETTQFVKGMDKANKETQSFGDKLGDFAKKAGIALAAVAAAAGAMAIKIGKEAVQAASDLAETTSKVGVIFGDTAKNIESFGAKAAASLGQTRTQAMDAAATFGIFGKSAGLAGQDLSKFSIEFVTLASDLASFNNTSVDEAIVALGAALRGESEPIRKYGVLLNDATLKAKAMEMGIYEGTGTLTAQQKVLAAHQVILQQTRDAQGDFARTADGMANSQRILSARLEEAKIVLGTALLPIVLELVKIFNERFLPVIEKIAGSFGGNDGFIARIKETVNTIRDGLAPILDAVRKAFDNVTNAVKTNEGNFKSFLDLVVTMWQFFNTYFVPILKNQVAAAIQGIGTAFSLVIKIVSPVIGVISDAINGLLKLLDAAIQRINSVIEAYNKIAFLPNIPTISSPKASPIAPNIQLPFGGGSVGGGTSSGSALPNIPGLTGSSAATGATTAAAATSAAASAAVAATAAAKAAQTIVDLTPKFAASPAEWRAFESGDLINMPSTAISANFDPARFRAAEEGNITIVVQAPSIIDENGFTRAVVDALNQTEARLGGGGSQLIL